MPDWNSEYVFNATADDGGFFWNGADYLLLIRLHETLSYSDTLTLKLATLILSEKFNLVYDEILQTALLKKSEYFDFEEETAYSTLFSLMESFDIKDEFSDLIVFAYLYDKQSIIDDAKILSNYLYTDDSINIKDISTIEALLNIADKLGLKDLIGGVQFVLTMYDTFNMTDRSPKTAITDFLIGVSDEYDNAYDWLLPFGLKIDWNNSVLQVMPEAELTTIEMPSIDGSIVEDTIYRDRLFNIVGYSELGLTIQEKESLKAHIAEVLDTTKKQKKKLTVQHSGISFDVKYNGSADITEGPSYVRASIPFLASPYGNSSFDNDLEGAGLISNTGDAPLGVKHIIRGSVYSPSFTLGEITYTWTGNVPSGSSLVIDHEMMTCYIVDSNMKKHNALSKLKGNFQKIPSKSSVVLNISYELNGKIRTEWTPKFLWIGGLQS